MVCNLVIFQFILKDDVVISVHVLIVSFLVIMRLLIAFVILKITIIEKFSLKESGSRYIGSVSVIVTYLK